MAKKIVLTGGPGGGKTTALDLFRRELLDKVVIVPEAATLLFKHGIPRPQDFEGAMRTQLSIFYMQKNLEKIYRAQFPDSTLICDRGCVDSLAYWPEEQEKFLEKIAMTRAELFNRYDAVIFFESAACSGRDIHSNNPYRSEDEMEAIELNNKLRNIWEEHPHYFHVGSEKSFIDKITLGAKKIREVLNQD